MPDTKLIVIAIGGNSLIEDAKHVSVAAQYEAARKTAEHIVRLASEGHRIVIAHGNGPQVGFILRRAEFSRRILHSVPLDSCVADTQGAIGYNLQMALHNEFIKAGINRPVATVVTQVEVDKDDQSFINPSKPIGTFMTREDAEYHRDTDGWNVIEDSGRGYRRVVASPLPKNIIELDSVRTLLDSGVIVIAAGGGGIPVTVNEDGTFTGAEAVIDKDLAAALMAKELKADLFVISTAVEQVCLNFGKPDQKSLDTVSVAEVRQYMNEGHFAPGSMLPKMQAIVDFIEASGNMGVITNPQNLYDAVNNEKGTHIVR
ncbi:MAG: carbamate kinase [Spirochaetia bacterium]|nr:carbamate kinase [Spirochaetia bacterium]MCF7941977.1 carbamate kinase [Spirochaetia bacterium]